jgi:membrane associated rhomboid family serine protease
MHIFFIMFALYSFGSVLENIWEVKNLYFLYFLWTRDCCTAYGNQLLLL